MKNTTQIIDVRDDHAAYFRNDPQEIFNYLLRAVWELLHIFNMFSLPQKDDDYYYDNDY